MNDFAAQGSGDWLRERAGKITASRFGAVIAKKKDLSPMKARDDYLWELVTERLTGWAADHLTSTAMQWGTDNEQGARRSYEARTGAMVEEVGFILHPALEGVGGSPDGLIGRDGGWEGKCPWNSAVHLQTILGGMPEEHRPQVQGLMWITGRAWWDFTSFDPRLPPPFDLHVERIMRDEAFIANLAHEIAIFGKDIATMLARLALHERH